MEIPLKPNTLSFEELIELRLKEEQEKIQTDKKQGSDKNGNIKNNKEENLENPIISRKINGNLNLPNINTPLYDSNDYKCKNSTENGSNNSTYYDDDVNNDVEVDIDNNNNKKTNIMQNKSTNSFYNYNIMSIHEENLNDIQKSMNYYNLDDTESNYNNSIQEVDNNINNDNNISEIPTKITNSDANNYSIHSRISSTLSYQDEDRNPMNYNSNNDKRQNTKNTGNIPKSYSSISTLVNDYDNKSEFNDKDLYKNFDCYLSNNGRNCCNINNINNDNIENTKSIISKNQNYNKINGSPCKQYYTNYNDNKEIMQITKSKVSEIKELFEKNKSTKIFTNENPSNLVNQNNIKKKTKSYIDPPPPPSPPKEIDLEEKKLISKDNKLNEQILKPLKQLNKYHWKMLCNHKNEELNEYQLLESQVNHEMQFSPKVNKNSNENNTISNISNSSINNNENININKNNCLNDNKCSKVNAKDNHINIIHSNDSDDYMCKKNSPNSTKTQYNEQKSKNITNLIKDDNSFNNYMINIENDNIKYGNYEYTDLEKELKEEIQKYKEANIRLEKLQNETTTLNQRLIQEKNSFDELKRNEMMNINYLKQKNEELQLEIENIKKNKSNKLELNNTNVDMDSLLKENKELKEKIKTIEKKTKSEKEEYIKEIDKLKDEMKQLLRNTCVTATHNRKSPKKSTYAKIPFFQNKEDSKIIINKNSSILQFKINPKNSEISSTNNKDSDTMILKNLDNNTSNFNINTNNLNNSNGDTIKNTMLINNINDNNNSITNNSANTNININSSINIYSNTKTNAND
ncbi:hypothetical protein BCR36DRAFT_352225, partial [Piromyces finnis]